MLVGQLGADACFSATALGIRLDVASAALRLFSLSCLASMHSRMQFTDFVLGPATILTMGEGSHRVNAYDHRLAPSCARIERGSGLCG